LICPFLEKGAPLYTHDLPPHSYDCVNLGNKCLTSPIESDLARVVSLLTSRCFRWGIVWIIVPDVASWLRGFYACHPRPMCLVGHLGQ